MSTLFSTFCATAPAQLKNTFFDAQQERLHLTTHMYGENNDIRLVCGVRNAYLIDCVEQDLKSLTNLGQATQIYLNTPLDEYLRHFNVLIPGDWPSQFYQRQLAYNAELHLPQRSKTPTMGPLHVSLNAQENVVRKFIIFFQRFYHHLFNKQLPLKPKPWRVTLLLQLLYRGWTIIRPAVLARPRRFKDIQFLTLLNLVDNYSPLTLAIYSKISQVLTASNSIDLRDTICQRGAATSTMTATLRNTLATPRALWPKSDNERTSAARVPVKRTPSPRHLSPTSP